MPQFYTVQQGDTLHSISERFGVSLDDLITMNQLDQQNILRVGQVLVVNDLMDDGFEREAHRQTDEIQLSDLGISFSGQGTSNIRVIDGLRYQILTNRSRYNTGQPVNITFIKTNISSTPRILSYNTGQRFDIEAVRGDGRVVWRWSSGRVFTQQFSEVILRPGQSQVFRAVWNQRNFQGFLVAPQTISLRAFNYARGLRNRSVTTNIVISRGIIPTPAPTPSPIPGCRPGVNLIVNGGFEFWPSPGSAPRGWEGSNVSRQESIRRSNIYSARLGSNPSVRARLSQNISGSAGRIYRLSYWVRETGFGGSNFIFRARVLFYNAAGRLIGTADPEYTEDFIPENFVQLAFSTGRTPPGTRSLEVRFDFTPQSGNSRSIALDDVFFQCLS